MNKFYLIAPVALLAVFIVFFIQFREDFHKKEEAKLLVAKQISDKKAADKLEAETKAKQDAIQRENERKAEEKKAEDDRKKRHQDAVDKLQKQIDDFKASSAKFSAELAAKEKTLSELRSEFERNTREVFDLSKKVEAAKIQVRNAELEIQRFTEMVSRKAAESSMAKAPVVTATP